MITVDLEANGGLPIDLPAETGNIRKTPSESGSDWKYWKRLELLGITLERLEAVGNGHWPDNFFIPLVLGWWSNVDVYKN